MSWSKKERRTVTLLSAVLFVLTIAGFELGLLLLDPSAYHRDRLLGWTLKKDFEREFTQRTYAGKEYIVQFATDKDGYRTFGTPKASVKILALGDSFTADPYASNAHMWYAAMARRLAVLSHRPVSDFYVKAGGGGGWGTYQQLLLAKSLSRTFKPDLVVLQFCSNDFQNNLYEWESQGVVRGQYMRRPFASLKSDEPRYTPGLMAWFYRSAMGQSRIFNRIDTFIGGIQFSNYGGYIRPLPAATERKLERDSLALTGELLKKLRNVYPDVPAALLNCDGNETGMNRQWKSLALAAGFVPLGGPSDFIRNQRKNRGNLFNLDGSHLSNDGNESFGKLAADGLVTAGLRF